MYRHTPRTRATTRGDTTKPAPQGEQSIQRVVASTDIQAQWKQRIGPSSAEHDMRSDQVNRRQPVAAAAVLLAILTVAGCREGTKDQAVIERLGKLDIVTIPAGSTKMNSTQAKGGGSDLAAIRGAPSVLVEYASPLPVARVREFYHWTYDGRWELSDDGASPLGEWWGSGASTSDPQMNVEVRVRPPAMNDKAPAGTKSVVGVSVSDALE